MRESVNLSPKNKNEREERKWQKYCRRRCLDKKVIDRTGRLCLFRDKRNGLGGARLNRALERFGVTEKRVVEHGCDAMR